MSNVDTTHMQASLTALGVTMYQPGYVAWCDGDRGVNPDGSLNVFGTNNTDCKLKGKNGQVFPYLKGNNYDEPLGVTTADRVNLGCENGKVITAQSVLESIAERSQKSGFGDVHVEVQKNHPVVVRFMNAFVPLANDQTKEFVVPTHYSYQTLSKKNPRNLIVCGHKGGIDVQADDQGDNPLFSLDYKSDGSIDTHYYTVESSEHAVGIAQTTSDGSEQPPEIGIKGMGPRGNAFCVMSIPNKQSPPTFESDWNPPVYRSLCANVGTASAAVLGVDGETTGVYDGGNAPIVYDTNDAIVITILYYNTIRNTRGADRPVAVSAMDIAMAVGDMDKAYRLCHGHGRLSELPDMLKAMTKEALEMVKQKLVHDPPMATSNPSKKRFVFQKNATAQFVNDA